MSVESLVSVIVPVTERFGAIQEVFSAYKEAMERTDLKYEFVYVLDGGFQDAVAELEVLRRRGEPLQLVLLAQRFGEAAALNAGVRSSVGDLILTLPAYLQVKSEEIPKLVRALGQHDMVVARRSPRVDSGFNVTQGWLFNALVRALVDCPFRDLGCSVRCLRRQVAEEINIYGDQHRFLPLIAYHQGYSVIEVDAVQEARDAFQRVYAPGLYVRRVLDILSVYFLIKFTTKPLRFFGLIGSTVTASGGVLAAWLFVERVFFGVALADRPLLLLASLLIVLGVQIIATGLVSELIIFVNRAAIKSYRIARIVDRDRADARLPASEASCGAAAARIVRS